MLIAIANLSMCDTTMELHEMKTKMKQKFTNLMNTNETNCKRNSALITNDKYLRLIEDVKRAKESQKKVSRDYWLQKHYDILVVSGIEKLIVPMKEIDTEVVFYIMKDDLFNVLYDTHLAIGHGGRDRMIKELNKKYKNITQGHIKSFLDTCETCLQKRKTENRGVVVKPIVSKHLKSRCQVDLIDFQSHPDGNYKFIMVYQDNLTKFIVLKPLETTCVEEVSCHILEIFLLLGAPYILQSESGSEFCNKVIESVQDMWPELKIVHGKPKHSRHQGSVEGGDQDVENMLTNWMQQNRTNNWSKRLQFFQFMKNRAYHSSIKATPYKAMFGVEPKVGLTTSSLPKELISSLRDEDDLNRLLQGMEKDINRLNIKDTDMESIAIENDGNIEHHEENDETKCVICLQNCSESYSVCTDCLKPAHVKCVIENDESFQQKQSENEVLVESCSPVIKSNKEKRKRRSPSEHKEDIIINETMANFRAPKDEFDIFGEFVATELRCIRSDENRRKLKRKIQKAILDVAEEDDM